MPSKGASSKSRPVEREDTNQSFLVEYQAAQASAEHHDVLLWSVTSTVWGASLILLGFVLGNLNEATLRPLISFLSVMGVVLSVFVWLSAWQFRSLKIQKYLRCKQIETSFNFHQHTDVRYPGRIAWIFYCVVMCFFVIGWILVLATAI
jgi:hypothetical protein